MSKLLAVYGAFEALLLLCSAFFGHAWFYSSQTAFLGSLLVLAATFRAYKKRVENGVREYDGSLEDENDEWGENHEEFPDTPQNAKFDGLNQHRQNAKEAAAKFDADGGLNLSGANQSGQSNLSQTEPNLNQVEQNNQTNFNKNSEQNLTAAGQSDQAMSQVKSRNFARNLKRNSPNYFTAFVPFRLIAYAVLVVGFLSLQRHGNLDLAAFLIALAAMPAGALIYGVKSNEN